MITRPSRQAVACAVYLVVHLAAHLAAAWMEVSTGVSIWYPPAGLALAFLVLLGPRYAPVVFAANMVGALMPGGLPAWWAPMVFPALITGTFTLAAWIVRKLTGPRLLPESGREMLVFVLTALAAPAILSLAGTACLNLMGLTSPAAFWSSVLFWWIGDASGILTVMPVAMVFAGPWLRNEAGADVPDLPAPRISMLAPATVLAACIWISFAVEPLPSFNAYYVCFIPLVWICLNYGLPGGTLASLFITLGCLIGLHVTDASQPVLVNFLFFEVTVIAIGIGLGTAVMRWKRAERERHEHEQRMLHLQKSESLGALAGGIAHDFNNLLTTILGNTSLVRLALPGANFAREPLQHIETAARRAAGLCQQIMAYACRTPPAVADVDLTTLVEETRELLQVSLSRKVSMELQLTRPLAPVRASASQLQQVIMNLVLNAAQALNGNGGRITIRTSPHASAASTPLVGATTPALPPGNYVVLEVEDTGCGMPEDVRRRIFEPYFTTKTNGHGMGLAAVQGIVNSLRGAIEVRSTPGRGTTFRLFLSALNASTRVSCADEGTEDWATQSGLVLVVDDEPGVQSIAARMLEDLGFRIALASDGAEAVARFDELHSHLRFVLLDMAMPQMDGAEAFTEMHRINPTVPVIVMSGYTQTLALDRFQAGRPVGFLSKPFDQDALRRRVATITTASRN